MSEIKTIVVKKSILATYKGLGETNGDIAKRLGIATSEVSDALIHFGMSKGKKTPKRDYVVQFEDDLSIPALEEEPQEEEMGVFEEEEL